jgi:predicted O-methyltransferase YrrM
MNLNEALVDMANELGLDARDLIRYAAEWDGSKHPKQTGTNPHAHLIDRKILYALVRATKPQSVLESGTNAGNGANVILAALAQNGGGELITVDVLPDAGNEIAAEYDNCELRIQDICDFVDGYHGEGFDFIHEDASHEVHTVRVVYEYLHKLSPDGCVIISHDTGTGVGTAIRTGIKDAGFGPLNEYQPEGSLGYSLMRYEGNHVN